MFIKATKTHSDRRGGARRDHRLIRNTRVDGRVQQETLLNIGTGWARHRNCGPASPTGPRGSCSAGNRSLPTATRWSSAPEAWHGSCGRTGPGFRAGRIRRCPGSTWTTRSARTRCRSERVCPKALGDLDFERILLDRGLWLCVARISPAVVAARMIHPSSEREASRCLQADRALPELLGLTGKRGTLTRKTLYRMCYLLWKHHAALR